MFAPRIVGGQVDSYVRELKIQRMVNGKDIRRSEGFIDGLYGTGALDAIADHVVVSGSLNGVFESRYHGPRSIGPWGPNILLQFPSFKWAQLRRGLISLALRALNDRPCRSIGSSGPIVGSPGVYGWRPVCGILLHYDAHLTTLIHAIILGGEGVKCRRKSLEGDSCQSALRVV